MNHFVVSAFIVFIFTLLVGSYFVFGGRGKTEKFFGFFWLCISFWTFFVGNQSWLLRWMSGLLWGWLLHLGCIFVPILFLQFALHLTRTIDRFFWVLKVAYLLGLGFLLLILFTDWFTGELVYRDLYAYPKPEFLYPLYILFFQAIAVGTFILLFQWARKRSNRSRRLVYLFLFVHILAFLGSMDNYLIMYDRRIFPLYPFGLYLILPYVLVGSYALGEIQQELNRV